MRFPNKPSSGVPMQWRPLVNEMSKNSAGDTWPAERTKAKGYNGIYSEYTGGYNEICWRGSPANAIITLTTPGPKRR